MRLQERHARRRRAGALIERRDEELASLEEGGGRYGVQTMCESGGMANATLIERL